MRIAFFCTIAVLSALGASPARALVHIDIDLTRQRMHVAADEGSFDWPVSSARSGFSTPGGSYAPTHLELMHYSRKYDMAPMPHAIFFRGGYAIHGTYATGSLGRPASHGCVRLAPGNAARLFAMVRHEGARISIHGSPPATRFYADRHTGRVARERFDGGEAAPDAGFYGDAPYVPRVAGQFYSPGYVYAPSPYSLYDGD